MDLVKEIYKVTKRLPKEEIYALSSQMRKSAISVPSNIAEGQLRKNLREYLQFLRIAYSSSAELETQLLLAKELYPKINYEEAEKVLAEVQKMFNVLISKLESRS